MAHEWTTGDPPPWHPADVKLLLVSPELAPFVNTGAVAEGVAALARALVLRGHDVTVAIPRYAAGEPRDFNVTERAVLQLTEPTRGEEILASVFDATLRVSPNDAVPPLNLLLIELPGFHEQHGIWGHELTDVTDNARRFALFSRVVLEMLRDESDRGAPFDVVHVHDWPMALIPYLLREERTAIPHTRSVLTIHNMYFQGIFPIEAIDHFGFDDDHRSDAKLGFHGRMNFLKGGILSADAVSTVSPSYAREICTPKFGEMLDTLLRARRSGVNGITNGIDVLLWNPATDPHIAKTYDATTAAENKRASKAALLREVGIENEDAPLIVSLGRVCAQKGSDLLAKAAPEILALGVNLVVAGVGEPEMMDALKEVARAHPKRFAYVGFAEEPMAHRMIAGGDALVMPSRFEPCGIVQMYGQRYGTLPIAFRTGGLGDTIVDLAISPNTGNGILYEDPTPAGMVAAIARGLRTLESDRWGTIRARMMALNVSWSRPVHHYEQMFRQLFRVPRS